MSVFLVTVAGTAFVYLLLIGMIHILGKRELTQFTVADLVFTLLVANALQDAMVKGDLKTLGLGVTAALTLFVLNHLLSSLMYGSRRVRQFVEGSPVILIRHGKVLHHNMRHEKITTSELAAALREHGFEGPGQVEVAILETDGEISVLRSGEHHASHEDA